MKLFLLFLSIVLALFASTHLALVSAESERTKEFTFDSIQRYLSVNSTIGQEDEERTRKLTNKQILTAIEQFLPKLSGFSYDSIKYFANLYFTTMELRVHLMDDPPDTNAFILSSLFTEEHLNELCRRNLFRFEQHLDIALYLVLLLKVDGSTLEAAKQIDSAMKYGTMKNIALKMEDGQFHLWNHVLKTEERVRRSIFRSRHDVEWRNKVLERYQNFLANEEKRHIPGIIETSAPRF